jgi:hypothetical protein
MTIVHSSSRPERDLAKEARGHDTPFGGEAIYGRRTACWHARDAAHVYTGTAVSWAQSITATMHETPPSEPKPLRQSYFLRQDACAIVGRNECLDGLLWFA